MTLLSTGTDYDALAAAFRPIFTRIAQGAAEREQQRILPDEPIRWLKEAGFGTLRIPREKGGWGASLPQLSALLIELAQADSNLPQALRAHFAFVEDQLNQPDSAGRDRWFRRFLDGELVGSGWTEIGAVKLGEVNTLFRSAGDSTARSFTAPARCTPTGSMCLPGAVIPPAM